MNWGIIGYGRIARKFEESLSHTDHRLCAIATRSSMDDVKPNITAYKSYQNLLADERVDIVYVATTHNTHADISIAALKAGKHVLCEKPMSISANTVIEMTQMAQKSNRFLMEAIWSRYLPGYSKALSLIKEGAIGDIKMISVHFGFKMNPDAPKQRLINPELAGGAIWDVGIYPVSLIQDIYGDDPEWMKVDAECSTLGIEERVAAQLSYSNKRMAQLSCAFNISTPNYALITGTNGNIVMEDFWKCEKFTVNTPDESKRYHLPMVSTGLYHETIACIEHIKNGLIQSPRITWDNSIQMAQIMDEMIQLSRS